MIGMIASPELTRHVLRPEDQFLVIATDGVWEFLSNEEVLSVVKQHFEEGKKAQEACKYIIARAALAWKKSSDLDPNQRPSEESSLVPCTA